MWSNERLLTDPSPTHVRSVRLLSFSPNSCVQSEFIATDRTFAAEAHSVGYQGFETSVSIPQPTLLDGITGDEGGGDTNVD